MENQYKAFAPRITQERSMSTILPSDEYISAENIKYDSAQKVCFPLTHDFHFSPGEEIKLTCSDSNIPNKALCIKEYPYFYLFRTLPVREGAETFNFAVNKYNLYCGIGHVKFDFV